MNGLLTCVLGVEALVLVGLVRAYVSLTAHPSSARR